MIAYSIFNINKMDINETVTIRIDEGEFNNSVVIYNNIKLNEQEEQITYGIEIDYLKYNDIECVDETLYLAIGEEASNRFIGVVSDIFNDMLRLFKGDIKYDE